MVYCCCGVAVGGVKINEGNVNGQNRLNGLGKRENDHWIETKFDATEQVQCKEYTSQIVKMCDALIQYAVNFR